MTIAPFTWWQKGTLTQKVLLDSVGRTICPGIRAVAIKGASLRRLVFDYTSAKGGICVFIH